MKRSSLVLALCAGILLVATCVFLLYPSRGLPDAALRAMPTNIHGFVRVRVARLLASKVWREIVVDRKEDRGIQRVTRTCGFNPLEGLSEIFVFALPGDKDTDVVVNARSRLSHTKLIDCATKFSGGTMASFVYERVAGFDSVRSKKGSERAAFVGRDGFVAGGAEGVSATLRSLAGETPNAERDPLLNELYTALSDDSEIALVLRVPKHPKLREALAAKLSLAESALPTDVQAVWLELHLVGDLLRVDLGLRMQNTMLAEVREQEINETRSRVLAMPGLGLIGVATPLRTLRVERVGVDVKLHGEVKASTVNLAIDRLPALAAMQTLTNRGAAADQPADAGAPVDSARAPAK